MKLKAFSIYDSKVGAFLQPFFARATGEALRHWEELANDGKSPMSRHSADYTLFETGTFDDETGRVEMLSAHINLGTALQSKINESPLAPVSKISNS